MLVEAREAPAAVARQLASDEAAYRGFGAALRARPPASMLTLARGSYGPMALIGEGYPLLVFAPRGPAQAGLLALADAMRQRGARVLLAAPRATPGCDLPLVETGAIDLDPLSAIQSFYPMVEALAKARGLDPDRPQHLTKVTRTR